MPRGIRAPKSLYARSTDIDVARFYEALEQRRVLLGLTWQKVAEETNLNNSLFTRLAAGRNPHLNAYLALMRWLDEPDSKFALCSKGVSRALSSGS